MKQTMDQLLDMMEPGSRYTPDRRREAVGAYKEYLEAYKEVIYWKIAAVEADFPGDYGQEIYEWIAHSNSCTTICTGWRH